MNLNLSALIYGKQIYTDQISWFKLKIMLLKKYHHDSQCDAH